MVYSSRGWSRAERLRRQAGRSGVGKKYSMFFLKLRPLSARGMPRTVLHRLWTGDAEKKSPPRTRGWSRAERLRRPAPVAGRSVGRELEKKIFDVHPETPATSRPWYATHGAICYRSYRE